MDKVIVNDDKKISITPSNKQTKEWRQNQDWYKNGKSNECEKYQINLIEKIIGTKLNKTNDRIYNNEIKNNKNPMLNDDGYEYTENFDGVIITNNKYYFNFKFVCDDGGAQRRTGKDVYNFVKEQLEFLIKNKTNDIYFINIFDGEYNYKNINKYNFLIKKSKYNEVIKYVFIGDSYTFEKHQKNDDLENEFNILNNIKNNNIIEMNKKEITNTEKNKKKYGQFYTKKHKYILQGMEIPNNVKNIIEPFTGNGDLINFIKNKEKKNNVKYIIECYDIEPKKNYIIKKDTIKNPPNYKDKYIITNPPYLARNKSKNKSLFEKYKVNDLYKCVIKNILTNICLGGIIIIPLNFWSSIRIADIELRKKFLEKYNIILLNIFEEQVFDDTTYTICSFQFELKNINNCNKFNNFNTMIYPSKINIKTELNDNNNYMIGGDIYKLKLKNKYKITRLTTKNKSKLNTNILVKCIDDNSNSKIGLSYVENKDIYIDDTPKQTSRTYATLIIEPIIDKDKQKKLIKKFNKYLEKHRKKYNSLFLTNYRESNSIARKRISFKLVYDMCNFLL